MNFDFKNGNFDLFNPLILVVMVILFLIIAMPMWYFYRELPAPNLELYLYIGLGLLFFIFGVFISNYFMNNNFKADVGSTTKENLYTEKLSLSDSYSKNELILVGIVSLGILLQIINIVLLKIPLPIISHRFNLVCPYRIQDHSYCNHAISTHYLVLHKGC